MGKWAWVLLPVAVAAVVGRGLGWVLPAGWRPFWRRVAWPSAGLLAVAGMGAAMAVLRAPAGWRRLDGDVGFVWAVAVAADWSYQALHGALRAYWQRLEGQGADGREVRRTIEPIARWAVGLTVAAVAAGVAFAHFGLNLSALLATAGVASVAVALAAQATLSNLLAGIIVLLERPFREGDWIVVGGDSGEVMAIGLRSTVLRTAAGSRVVLPNAVVTGGRLENLTAAGALLVRLSLAVACPADQVEAVGALLLDTMRRLPGQLNRPAPQVRLLHCDGTRFNWDVGFWIAAGSDPAAAREAAVLAAAKATAAGGWGLPVSN